MALGPCLFCICGLSKTKNTQLMAVYTGTVRMAKSRPRKNQSERSNLPCHIIKEISAVAICLGPLPQYAALFLRLGLPSTLIRHENRAFGKRSLNRRNLITPALWFSVDGKYLTCFQSKHAVFKFPRGSIDVAFANARALAGLTV